VRVDAGVEEGGEVPVYYDPMISKLSVWAPTRAAAIARMDRALAEYSVAGVETTISFCRFVMQHAAFQSGHISTRFVEEHFRPEVLTTVSEEEAQAAALAAVLLDARARPSAPKVAAAEAPSRWAARRWM
jgi:acetyl-CoA carboxylase, biotin carboxylase subunit